MFKHYDCFMDRPDWWIKWLDYIEKKHLNVTIKFEELRNKSVVAVDPSGNPHEYESFESMVRDLGIRSWRDGLRIYLCILGKSCM